MGTEPEACLGKLPPACREGAQWELACHKRLAVREYHPRGISSPLPVAGVRCGVWRAPPGKGARAGLVFAHPTWIARFWLSLNGWIWLMWLSCHSLCNCSTCAGQMKGEKFQGSAVQWAVTWILVSHAPSAWNSTVRAWGAGGGCWCAFLEKQVWVAWPLSPGSEQPGTLSRFHLPSGNTSQTYGVGLSLPPWWEAGQSPGQTRGSGSAEKRGHWAGELLEGPGTTLISANGIIRVDLPCLWGLEPLRGSLMSIRGAKLMGWAGFCPQDS